MIGKSKSCVKLRFWGNVFHPSFSVLVVVSIFKSTVFQNETSNVVLIPPSLKNKSIYKALLLNTYEINSSRFRVNDEDVRLMLWDTAGQEEFDAITKAYYRGKLRGFLFGYVLLPTQRTLLFFLFSIEGFLFKNTSFQNIF